MEELGNLASPQFVESAPCGLKTPVWTIDYRLECTSGGHCGGVTQTPGAAYTATRGYDVNHLSGNAGRRISSRLSSRCRRALMRTDMEHLRLAGSPGR